MSQATKTTPLNGPAKVAEEQVALVRDETEADRKARVRASLERIARENSELLQILAK